MQLSEDQIKALQEMEDFVESSTEKVLVLRGYAGTGKSFITKEFMEYVDSKDIPFALCAPTHKAKLVLEEASGYNAITIHKLLSMAPNVEIFELDYSELKFYSTGFKEIPYNGLIIVDEASMVNSALFKLLTEVGEKFNSKIIFIGDDRQLQPVKEGDVSPVFKCKNMITLTKIHRQSEGNGLLPLLVDLRKRYKPRFDSIEAPVGSLEVFTDPKDFIIRSLPFFKKAIKDNNVNEVKLLAYTNDRVSAFNKCIRRAVLKEKSNNQFNKGEIITGYDNFEYNRTQIWNSLDYVITTDPIQTTRKIPYFISLPGYELELYDTVYKSLFRVFVLDQNIEQDYIDSLCQLMETTRMNAISAKNNGNRTLANTLWQKYFSILNSFATSKPFKWDNRTVKKKTFDYGYCSTVHKIQGCSINNIFMDMKNVFSCRDLNEIRQMQYVGISRTKNNAYILQ